jgi:hypothetical protein
MARLAKETRTQVSAARSHQEGSFCKGQAVRVTAARRRQTVSEEQAEASEAGLRRPILAAQARRDCQAADRVDRAGQPLHFEVLAEGGPDREAAARRRKASRRFMACNA